MSKKKSHSVYESKKRDCLFHKQFDLWEKSNWNVDLPPFFKRLNNLKHTGKILPGHGGLLDRIDGMIFAIPFSYLIHLLFL